MSVGSLCQGLPAYVYQPPIEAVVFGWGVSEDGQLALDTSANVLAPKVVEALLGTRFRGREFGAPPLVAGSRNTLAITADGEVFSWGWNARATLGHGHRNPERKPRRIAGLKGVQVDQVALGGWHALAVDSQGQVWAWGGNEYEQCGHADASTRDVTVPTRCLGGLRVSQVAAGGMHSLALTDTGDIWMWGEPWGDFSMTIDRTPRRVDAPPGAARFVRIACGAFHNLALSAAGDLYTWGINDFGQLGNGTTSYATAPQQVSEGLEGVVVADVAAGGWHSLAISDGGEVYIWGRGEYGRLGLGDKTGSSRLRPTRIKALEGVRVVEGACGGTHTMAVTDEGRAFIWGRGAFGRLGTGTEQDYYAPVEVKLPGGPERWRVISAAVGGRHSFVLALPDNGDLAERMDSHAAWLARRSPSGLSPRIGGLHLQLEPEGGGVGEGVAPSGVGPPEAQRPAQEVGGWAAQGSAGAMWGEGEADDEGGERDEAEEVEDSPEGTSVGGGSLKELEELQGSPAGEGGSRLEGALHHFQAEAGQPGLVGTIPRVGSSAGMSASMSVRAGRGLIDNEDEEEGGTELGDGRVCRAQSLAAARLHGLRDDLPGQ